MAKAAIPRFLVPLLIAGALVGATFFILNKGGDSGGSDAKIAADPGKPAEPPKPQRPDRPDVDLWERWAGKPLPEILAALAPAPPATDPASLASLDTPKPDDSDADPYLPRFDPSPDTLLLPPAESAATVGEAIILSSDGLPLSVWKLSEDKAEDVTAASGLATIIGGRRILPADFDRDGDPDLFIGRGGDLPDSLLRRGPDETHEDITESAGLLEFLDFADAAWVDIDQDGWLDLCVVQNPPKGSADSLIRLFHNQSGKSFADIAKASGLATKGRVERILWRDFDDDGHPDLVVSLAGKPGSLQWWRSVPGEAGGIRKFEDATATSGLQGIAGGGPLAAGDVDGDGRDDLILASEGALTILTSNPGAAPLFTDQTSQLSLTGIASPTALVVEDFDRDGIPDLFLSGGTPAAPESKAWWNVGGLQFREIPGGAGLAAPAPVRWIDPLDQTGWLIAAGGNWRTSIRQPASPLIAGRSRLAVRLHAPDSANRNGLGARVSVTTRDRNWIYRTLAVTVDDITEFIGLDEAIEVESIEIVWPDRERTRTKFEKLPVNQLLEIGPGSQDIRQTPLP